MVEQLVIAVLGLAATLVGMLGGALYWLGGKFREIDMRFREIDMRFGEVNARIDRLAQAFVSYQEFFTEFLTAEGILRAERAVLARNELARFIRLAAGNPFSEEEVRRLEELISKDELTLDEALELRELARKAIREYGEYPEAWKLHLYASIMVGLALRRRVEEERREP